MTERKIIKTEVTAYYDDGSSDIVAAAGYGGDLIVSGHPFTALKSPPGYRILLVKDDIYEDFLERVAKTI